MGDSQIYTAKMLSALFKLPVQDIEEIVASDGKLCFSADEQAFLVYVPIFEVCVRYDREAYGKLEDALDEQDYEVKIEDMVVVVSSEQHYPSSFLLMPNFAQCLEEYTDIAEDTAVLLTHSATTPLFFGQRAVIERLADDFEKADVIASVNLFLNWRNENV
jgi:hypothetical protein